MNCIEKSYWSLLKAGLWSDNSYLADFKPLSSADWSKIVKMGRRSSALGIVADGIEMLPEECLPEEDIINQFLSLKLWLIVEHKKHNLAIRHLMALFDDLGVKSVLLKGQSLAQVFAKPESREVGDIDIYIGDSQLDDLVQRLSALGYTCEEEINDTDKHVVFIYEEIPIELHRDSLYLYTPKTNRLYQQWWNSTIFAQPQKAYIDEKGKWSAEKRADSQCVLIPEITLNLFFTFCHLFGHYMNLEFQFKQFMDLARKLKTEKDQIDVPLLGKKLNELGMMKPWQVVGCYLHHKLGLKVEYIPFYDEAVQAKAEILDRQINERLFTNKFSESNRPNGLITAKLYSYYMHWLVARQTFGLFPRHTALSIIEITKRGIKVLFNKNHRPQELKI